MNSWLLVDCGLRTTIALVESTSSGPKLVARGESRTTLHPEGDVTLGVLAALGQVEEAVGRRLQQAGRVLCPRDAAGDGVDQLLVTSSVGGGLQMMVAGLVRIMTADSAERAALGAGANVLDVLSIDDGLMPHERISRMRQLRPDMFLFGGGVDGGNQQDVLEFAQEIAQAGLTSMPIVYAGNVEARGLVQETLGADFKLHLVDNMRPVLEQEILEPTREQIQQLYMRHVTSKAPGFAELSAWSGRAIMPSTGATSRLITTAAANSQQNLLAVHIGDSTTDVFSVIDGRFTRTVSADLGLGYSIANVAVKAGSQSLLRWLPGATSHDQLLNYLLNLMLSPAAEHPADDQELLTKQAVLREAARLALRQHEQRATALRGVHQVRDISAIFNQTGSDASLVKMPLLDLIIASASIFAWDDDRANAELLLDALQPEGITKLAIDRFGLTPQFGALAGIEPEVAWQVFWDDALTNLGVTVCPVGEAEMESASLSITCERAGQLLPEQTASPLCLTWLPTEAGDRVSLQPSAGLDIGAGRGRKQVLTMHEASCGLIIDLRKRVQA